MFFKVNDQCNNQSTLRKVVEFWSCCLWYLIDICPVSRIQAKIPRYGKDVFSSWSDHPSNSSYANKEATADDKQLIWAICAFVIQWQSPTSGIGGQSGGSPRRQFESVSRNCVTRDNDHPPLSSVCVWKSRNVLNLSPHQIRGQTKSRWVLLSLSAKWSFLF